MRGRKSNFSLGASVTSFGALHSGNYRRTSREYSLGSNLSTATNSSIYDNIRVGMELKMDETEQKKRQKIQRILSGNDYQITTYKIISTNKFQYTIMGCVILNILLLIMPTMPPTTPFSQWFKRNYIPLSTMDSIFLSIYITEMLLKIFSCRKEYFRNSWDCLDCAIVVFSLIDMANNIKQSRQTQSQSDVSLNAAKQFKVIRLLRATRMLRVLRTLKFVARLQRYTETIVKSMKDLGAILSLCGALMAVFAAVACALFGELIPKRFGNMTMTLFTLIQLITLDDWYEVIQEGSAERGLFNIPLFIFIITYIWIMVFIIFNLLLGVLVNNFQVANDEDEIRVENEKLQKTNSLDQMLNDREDDEDDDVVDMEVRKTIEMECAQTAKLLADRLKRTGNDGDFKVSFAHLPEDQFKLQEWYYRLLPACERQEFLFTNQFNAFNKMVQGAIEESEDI